MTVITSKENWPADSQEIRMKKGKLIRVERAPGQIVKMYRADAERLGYIKAQEKPQDKQRLPEQNKAPEPEEKPQADDFTVIPGVGPATARALAANGITTFDALRAAGSIDYLTEKANQAIQDWRNG
jgi:predicted flap endonuclease-1-like 5' DNA nuclease